MTKTRTNRPISTPKPGAEKAPADATEAHMRAQLRDLKRILDVAMSRAETLDKGGVIEMPPGQKVKIGEPASGAGFSQLVKAVRQITILQQMITARLAAYLRDKAKAAAAAPAPRETSRPARPILTRSKTLH